MHPWADDVRHSSPSRMPRSSSRRRPSGSSSRTWHRQALLRAVSPQAPRRPLVREIPPYERGCMTGSDKDDEKQAIRSSRSCAKPTAACWKLCWNMAGAGRRFAHGRRSMGHGCVAIAQTKALEDKSRRLKKVFAELGTQNQLLNEAFGNSKSAISATRAAATAVEQRSVGIALACGTFEVSRTCCRYSLPLSDKNG